MINSNYFSKHVAGQVSAIFFIQMSLSIAFAVFFSGLSIYLTQHEMLSQESAAVITSLFLSINYFLPLIGGIAANRVISYKRLYLLSTISSFFGCLLLAYEKNIYLGLAMFLMCSLAKVSLNMFLTQLFDANQKNERRIAFLWSYIGSNLGFMIGFLLTGFSTITNSYYYLFITISILVLLSEVLVFAFIKEPSLEKVIVKPTHHQIINFLAILLALVTVINFVLKYANYFHLSITLSAITLLGSVMWYRLKKSNKQEQKKLFKFITFSFFSILFWSIYMLTPVAIMQLILKDVQTVVFGIKLAPQWIVNIDSLTILMIAPLMTFAFKKGRTFFDNSYNYYLVAFIFASCAFFLLALGFYYSLGIFYISLPFILGYLIFLTLGEISITPISDALIGELIDEPSRGLMTGAWGMNICIGGLLASIIANQFVLPRINNYDINLSNNVHLEHVFFVISAVLLVFVATLLICSKMFHKNKLIYT